MRCFVMFVIAVCVLFLSRLFYVLIFLLLVQPATKYDLYKRCAIPVPDFPHLFKANNASQVYIHCISARIT